MMRDPKISKRIPSNASIWIDDPSKDYVATSQFDILFICSSCDNSVLYDFWLDLLCNEGTEADPEVDNDVRVRRVDAVSEELLVAISGERDDDDDDDDDCIVSFFSQIIWSLGLSSPVSRGDVIDLSFKPKKITISLDQNSSWKYALLTATVKIIDQGAPPSLVGRAALRLTI